MQTLRPYYRNCLGVGLYVWRDLELSQINKGKRVVGWNLTRSVTMNKGKNLKLKTGEESKLFGSLWQANQYLVTNYKVKIQNIEYWNH